MAKFLILPCLDFRPRWVQDPGTYSPWHGWFTVTSDSNFMKSSCRLQSELRLVLIRFAPHYCIRFSLYSHCIMGVAPDIRVMLIWRHPHLPPVYNGQSPWKYNIGRGLRSLTDLTEHLKARADDNHAAPVTDPAELHSSISRRFDQDVKSG